VIPATASLPIRVMTFAAPRFEPKDHW